MYPTKDQLLKRKLDLSQMENALLEEKLKLNIRLQEISKEQVALTNLIDLEVS